MHAVTVVDGAHDLRDQWCCSAFSEALLCLLLEQLTKISSVGMLQDHEGKMPKCCTLLSGDPNGKRTEQRICERLNEELQVYSYKSWTG